MNIDQLSVIWRSCWSEEMFPRSPRVFSSHWDWALSSHRGPESLPSPPSHHSLHSLLWSPSSSQLKASNSYYWHADNMQIFEEDKQKNKCSSSKSYVGQSVLQMWTSVVWRWLHFTFSGEIRFVSNSRPRPVLNLNLSLDWLTLSRYFVYYQLLPNQRRSHLIETYFRM